MAARRPLQPVDIATGIVSGTLAAAFLVLGGLAALPDDPATTTPLVIPAAVSHP